MNKKFSSENNDSYFSINADLERLTNAGFWTTDSNDRPNLKAVPDPVNNPSHYNYGSVEAIEIIEQAIEAAPSVKAGMLHAQVLKYLLRLWHKDNPVQDAEKAQWYLLRLIDSL